MNSLIGRHGMNPDKPKTEGLNLNKYMHVLMTRTINSSYKIDENLLLVTYFNTIDLDICKISGLDYFELLKNENNFTEKSDSNKFVSI